LVVGEDFRFGKDRQGDVGFLQDWADKNRVQFKAIPPLLDKAEKFGSSSIRSAIREGDFQETARMLGRPWRLKARVRKGQQKGRDLGFSTANLDIRSRVMPPNGVYAFRAWTSEGEFQGVGNLGFRPTVDKDAAEPTLEVHLLGYESSNRDLYGEIIQVEFVEFIRAEKTFSGLDELSKQIAEDVKAALALFQVSKT